MISFAGIMEHKTNPEMTADRNAGCANGSEPGSARYGNFMNYYSFNPSPVRINLIPSTTVKKIFSCKNENQAGLLGLDIGCNAGELTCALYEHFKQETTDFHVLGVDLDGILIERSNEINRHPNNVSFQVADILKPEDQHKVIQGYLQTRGALQFDVIFCFSITMWIHLNHGDEGLKQFLRFISTMAQWIVIEPQPWKCYRNARRRAKRLDCPPFEHFQELKWRENVDIEIQEFLTKDCKCTSEENLGKTSWDRQICVFKSHND